jgi:hypothetical protein
MSRRRVRRRSKLAEELISKTGLWSGWATVIYVALTLFLFGTSKSLTGSPWDELNDVITFSFIFYPWFVVSSTLVGLYLTLGSRDKACRKRGRIGAGLAFLSMIAIVVGRALL